MTDLVKELRQGSLNNDDYRWRAADRIEQLEAALREIIADSFSVYAIEVARAALEEQK